MKTLQHPNIIRVYDFYEDKSSMYLVTEFCAGGELFSICETRQHLTEAVIADIFSQVIGAIGFCHSKNIVHRDLKPENIMLDSIAGTKQRFTIKIIDFGTSMLIEPDQAMKEKVGTDFYMAPELLTGTYGYKCDIWSCGVILYVMLVGYPPFDGDTDVQIYDNIKNAEPKYRKSDWTSVSPEAKDLVQRMLVKNPEQRISVQDALNHPWIQSF